MIRLVKKYRATFHPVRSKTKRNRPFPRQFVPLSVSKRFFVPNHSCKNVFRLEVHFNENTTHFRTKGFVRGPVLKQRHNVIVHYDACKYTFPRFASATCNYFEFWLVRRILRALCDWLKWLLWFWFHDIRLKTALIKQNLRKGSTVYADLLLTVLAALAMGSGNWCVRRASIAVKEHRAAVNRMKKGSSFLG